MMRQSLETLWYVAYGSNIDRRRFDCYLTGGRPVGGVRTYPGCRDQTPPTAEAAVMINGGLFFAGTSRVWGGGMAFFDATAPSHVAAMAYLLTVDQFCDVVAQEMHRPPGTILDLRSVNETGTHTYGAGHDETVVNVGTRRGLPMLTFTCSPAARPPVNPPAEAYRLTIASGLRATHGWNDEQISEYLSATSKTLP